MSQKSEAKKPASPAVKNYGGLVVGSDERVATARRASARAVHAFMTATSWEIGRRIVEFEQGGADRAKYGARLLKRLSADLGKRVGRGFSPDNLETMRQFYRAVPTAPISETWSRKSGGTLGNEGETIRTLEPRENSETASRNSAPVDFRQLARAFPLPWSDYVLLVRRSRSPEALMFYQTEALRGGWSGRQLQRQMDSQFYERTALSRNKAAMLTKGAQAKPEDTVSAEEEIRHPLVLEFLGLKDEYSETSLEEGLVRHLEAFLLELGNDFAFVGRQRRLRIDDEWYRVDLLFFHRRLRCLVIFDLKLGHFTHADAGQMHVYLNYARKHWVQPGENPPVGVILCSGKGEALVRYATDSLPSQLLVREYLTALPSEKVLGSELENTRRELEGRK